MSSWLRRAVALLALAALVVAAIYVVRGGRERSLQAADSAWPAYNGHVSGDHYSALQQIDRDNVVRLQLAWRHDNDGSAETQTNPLVIGRTMYAYNARANIIALDAASGRELWKFDAGVRASGPHRGLVYWTDGRQARLLASA
jgi:quinoprotein glucose dehydrogenase